MHYAEKLQKTCYILWDWGEVEKQYCMEDTILQSKEERTIQCTGLHGMDNLHIYEGPSNAQEYISWHHIHDIAKSIFCCHT